MSDDLVKRLKDRSQFLWTTGRQLQDNKLAKAAADRIEELEGKLAKAVGALDKIKRIDNLVGVFAACERTLAELKGEK